MAEEPQVLSIKQRIAALNQSQVCRTPNGESPVPPFPRPGPALPSSRPLVVRTKSANNSSGHVTGTVPDNAANDNKPMSVVQPPKPVPSPCSKAEPSSPTAAKPNAPPPLPARRLSAQPAPALPPRRPSIEPPRKPSRKSLVKTNGVCKDAKESIAPLNPANNRLRAPAWGETELPPLPPKREELKIEQPPLDQKLPATNRLEQLSGLLPTSARDRLTHRLPSRKGSDASPKENGHYASVHPTPLTPKDGVEGSQTEPVPSLPVRKLPPPPSGDALDKIRQSGFARQENNHNANGMVQSETDQNNGPNGAPPPVPLASRPDLSKIQSTKPRLNALPASNASSNDHCLKCRDFTAPDNHAARYPRTSLPTQDLAWLAKELTSPFASLTDKARAIFTWLHHNIKYDVEAFFNNNIQPSTPARTLATGLAVCEGYAGLFVALATHAGLEARVISGHGKGYGWNPLPPGAPIPPYKAGHAWNAVKIDNGYWKLIDACWGAGAVGGPGEPYIQRFEPSMFTISNDEFGLKHFPENRDQFYRDDGRSSISWEEYIVGDSIEPLTIYGKASNYNIGERTIQPAGKKISVCQPGPIRFQFGMVCEHWTLERHTKQPPGLFLLFIHGIDGRQDDRILFSHVSGTRPGGGGDMWYVDIADPRTLGAPGQKLLLAVVSTFGNRQDVRGLTAQEFLRSCGRVGMSFEGIAAWELV